MQNNQPTVLIAEDEKPLSHALDLKLKKEGFNTIITEDGSECLKILEEENIDILLLDLIMPNVDGFHVLEYLKHHKRKIKIYVISNLSQPEDKDQALSLGAHKYIVKSNTSLAEIVEIVKSGT